MVQRTGYYLFVGIKVLDVRASDSGSSEPECTPDMGRGKRQRIKIRSDDDIM